MAKTSDTELLEAIAEDFHTYLRRGVRVDNVIGSAHPNLDIDDIETLLRIHFVLTDREDDPNAVGVLDFVRALESHIRHMKTSTSRTTVERRGEIRGHIDWQQTVKTRSKAGRLDVPLFVSTQPEEHYDIDENLVLKRLLSVIREIVYDDLEYALENPDQYAWLGDWTSSATDTERGSLESTADMFRRVFDRNIYLQRIDTTDATLTDRTIESVKRSRSSFYRQAAILLDRYRRLMQHDLDSAEARAILNHTLIAPEKTEVLFELYWLFRILDAYDTAQYHILSDERDNPSIVASWETGETRYEVMHDATGNDVTFSESFETESLEPDGYLYRLNAVLSKWQDLSDTLLDRGGRHSLWGGRPDIIVERSAQTDQGEWTLKEVFIGEVKYTQNTDYAAVGLRELLEYMAFVRRQDDENEYVEAPENLFESVNVKGLLFVDAMGLEISAPKDITIIQYPDSPGAVV